jgi:hypothetical protein
MRASIASSGTSLYVDWNENIAITNSSGSSVSSGSGLPTGFSIAYLSISSWYYSGTRLYFSISKVYQNAFVGTVSYTASSSSYNIFSSATGGKVSSASGSIINESTQVQAPGTASGISVVLNSSSLSGITLTRSFTASWTAGSRATSYSWSFGDSSSYPSYVGSGTTSSTSITTTLQTYYYEGRMVVGPVDEVLYFYITSVNASGSSSKVKYATSYYFMKNP